MNYENQAEEFAKKVGIELEVLDYRYGRMQWDDSKTRRYVFTVKLYNIINGYMYTYDFGQSIASGSKEPTLYDILTCLTKYHPESLEDFCSCYGYDIAEPETSRIFYEVLNEWENIEELIPEQYLEEFRKIC